MATREYPERPIVGVGAIILDHSPDHSPDARKVLLVRRGTEPNRGEWSLPGGAVQTGEKLQEAVRREILEETGLAVRVEEVVEVLDRILRDEQGRVRFHYVLVDFLCRSEGGRLEAATDVTETRWVSRPELPQYGLHPETLRVIEKAFLVLQSPPSPAAG